MQAIQGVGKLLQGGISLHIRDVYWYLVLGNHCCHFLQGFVWCIWKHWHCLT